MIFRFVVRRLRWLTKIPLLPLIFDAFLLALSTLTSPKKLRALQAVENAAVSEFGAAIGLHRFGGIGFFVNGAELGHVHGNGLLDVFVGRVNRDALVCAGRALRHHVFPAAGWVSFWIKGDADITPALELLRLARDRATIPPNESLPPSDAER